MKAKFEIEIEFDPAKRSRIIADGRKLFIQNVATCYDDDGSKVSVESEAPTDLQDALCELLQSAINDYYATRGLGIMVCGMVGPGELEDAEPIH